MKPRLFSLIAVLAAVALGPVASAQVQVVEPAPPPARSYQQIVRDVAQMVSDASARRLVGARGLNLVNVMWEDTGRYLGSSVGPNISDVTIEVEVEGRHGTSTHLMPVIRHPNFSDKTADVRLDSFYVRVGNQAKDGALRTVSLRELLANPRRYMSFPHDGLIKGNTLLAGRDTHALVSAQSAFLPIPHGGKATFWPVIFNYQSYARNPAVLTILVTRQGTSMTIVDNSRDTVGGSRSFGQRLLFNAGGERAPLTAERLADVVAAGTTSNGESASSLGDDSNLLLLIQVPLKVKQQPRRSYAAKSAPASAGVEMSASVDDLESDIDVAVLGHGPALGPYSELAGLTIERDPRFPVRVTVQFYQATSNGVVGEQDIARLARQIDEVYERGDYVGSLVVPAPGSSRTTEWDGVSAAPAGLTWRDFPGLVERYQRYGRYFGVWR